MARALLGLIIVILLIFVLFLNSSQTFSAVTPPATQWSQTYSANSESANVYSLVQTNDGGYIFVGTSSNPSDFPVNETSKDLLIKTNSWETNFGEKLLAK